MCVKQLIDAFFVFDSIPDWLKSSGNVWQSCFWRSSFSIIFFASDFWLDILREVKKDKSKINANSVTS